MATRKRPWNAGKDLFPSLTSGEPLPPIEPMPGSVSVGHTTTTFLPPPLYVRVAPGHDLPAPFLLFEAWTDDGFRESDLTAKQVDDVARQRGLRVQPVR